jgi:hypothetical protein
MKTFANNRYVKFTVAVLSTVCNFTLGAVNMLLEIAAQQQ